MMNTRERIVYGSQDSTLETARQKSVLYWTEQFNSKGFRDAMCRSRHEGAHKEQREQGIESIVPVIGIINTYNNNLVGFFDSLDCPPYGQLADIMITAGTKLKEKGIIRRIKSAVKNNGRNSYHILEVTPQQVYSRTNVLSRDTMAILQEAAQSYNQMYGFIH